MDQSLLLEIVRTFAVLLLGLYAGGVFFTVLAPSLTRLPGPAYLPYWHALNTDYSRAMPMLLLTTLVALVLTCFLSFQQGLLIFSLSIAALLLTVGTIVLTVTQVEPLNQRANSWTAEHLPTDWNDVRARWWTLHTMRTMLAVVAFGLLLIAQAIG